MPLSRRLEGFGDFLADLGAALPQIITFEVRRDSGSPSWTLRMRWDRRKKLRLALSQAQDRLASNEVLTFDGQGCAELARVTLGYHTELLVILLKQADERAFAVWRRELNAGEWSWTGDVLVVPETLAGNLCAELIASLHWFEPQHQRERVLHSRHLRPRPNRFPLSPDYRVTGLLQQMRWLCHNLLSFEAAFVLFLYSNELSTVVTFPFSIDETIVFAALAGGAGALIILRDGIYIRGMPIFVAALLFVLWVVTSAAWSPSRVLARIDGAYLLSFTMFSVAAGCLIVANRRERAVRFFTFVLLIATAMALYGLYIYFTYGDFRRWAGWEDVEARVYLAFGHTVVNGAGIAFCIAMFSRFATLRQVAGALLFAASALFLLVGGGRGPFLGVALAAMVGIATRPPIVGRDRILIPYTFLAAVMLVAIAASYVGYLLLSGHGTTTLDRFTKLANQSENAEMLGTANRFYYWSSAYKFFMSSPVIGNGLRSFSVMTSHGAEIDGTHPHNIVLQTLAETGLIGLSFLLLFLFIAAKHASFARLRHDPLFVCVVLFLITSSMSPMFGRDLAGVRKFFFAVSLLALRPPTGTRAQVGPRLSQRVQNRLRWRSVPSLRPAQA